MKDAFAPNTLEAALLYNDVDQEEGLLRLPAEAAEHARPDLERHAGEGRLQGRATSRPNGTITGRSGATRCSRRSARPPASASTASASRWAWNPTDSFQSFYTFMDAYHVKLVDDDGKLLVDDPKVRDGLIHALKDYTDTYIKGCTPPSSTTWKDPDNNVAFHNKTIVMTHNFTISIAAKWFEDSTNPALTPEQRAAGKKAYEQDIITASFPKAPDGSTDPLPLRRQDRADLRRRQEQGGGQAVHQLPDAGRKRPALHRGRARPLVPGDQGQPGEPVLAGRPASPARSTPSSPAAPRRSTSPRTGSSPSSTTRTSGPRR